MFLPWVRRGLRTGIVTTRYPAVPEPPVEGFRGRPVLDAERCGAGQGCRACTEVCLPQALTARSDKDRHMEHITLDYTRCVMCGLCATACPAGALSMSADYELAASRRADLVQSVTLVYESQSVDEARR
jgi:formate hydrogenlyase subunit 6/NADH:ubiquinone oxidoreductase subunit I